MKLRIRRSLDEIYKDKKMLDALEYYKSQVPLIFFNFSREEQEVLLKEILRGMPPAVGAFVCATVDMFVKEKNLEMTGQKFTAQ